MRAVAVLFVCVGFWVDCSGYEVVTDHTIHTAIAAWLTDPADASDMFGPIQEWNTSLVTSMQTLFYWTSFDEPIGTWDVSSVTNMFGLFWGNTAFNQDLSSWDTSNVRTFENAFSGASAFDGDVSARASGSTLVEVLERERDGVRHEGAACVGPQVGHVVRDVARRHVFQSVDLRRRGLGGVGRLSGSNDAVDLRGKRLPRRRRLVGRLEREGHGRALLGDPVPGQGGNRGLHCPLSNVGGVPTNA